MDPVSGFQQLGELSAQMLEAARAGDWERLGRLDADMATLRDALAGSLADGALARLPELQRKRIEGSIREALTDQARTREIVEPWLESTRTLLSGRSRERDLRASYGAFTQSG